MDAAPSPENPTPGGRASRADRAVSSITLALLVIFALGGAALDGKGVSLGLPAPGVLALGALTAAVAWFSGLSGVAGFLLPLVAFFIGCLLFPWLPSILLFSGRPLLAFVFAGFTLAVAAFGRKPPRWLLLPIFFALYAAVSYRVQTRVGPDGDEPQYLMVSESLIRDHDLALDQDFKEERYQAFFSRPLKPDFRIRGPQGQIYSLHAVGLSILILPAYWAFGYPGASFFMAFLAALLVHELRALVQDLTDDPSLAEGTAWLVGLSPPLIHFAGLIFTEIPAALLLCVGLRAAALSRTSRSALLSAVCAAALPWLNVRYSILALAVVVALSWRLLEEIRARPEKGGLVRALLPPSLVLIASAFAITLYHHALWGFFDPRRVYGQRREFSLDILPEGLPGLFFDQEFGLFVYAPIFVLSIAGFVHLFRLRRGLALAGLFAVFGVIATASVWPMWRGGFNPPGRFLVPLLSLLAATLALSLQRGMRPATALLAGWGLWCGLFGAMQIETVHRDRDGVAPFFRTESGAREWTSALPSFVLQQDRPTRALLWPWAALLALPVLGAMRARPSKDRPSEKGMLVAAASLLAVAAIADRMSPRLRSPERDAVRLVGSPSFRPASLAYEAQESADWALDLFYEPHRAPLGVSFARMLLLEPGRYELTLETNDVRGDSLPGLRVADHRSGKVVGPVAGPAVGTRSLIYRFTVDAAREFDLSLLGGEPLAFSRARLRRTDGMSLD